MSDLGPLSPAVARRLAELRSLGVVRRVWARDPTVWKDDPDTPEIRDRLGWLTLTETMREQLPALTAFAQDMRSRFRRVVLCGMGGSSLAPEVLARTFGAAPGYPSLVVLDSTDPRAVASALAGARAEETLFLISSKSGTTLEVDCFYRHFWEAAGARSGQFVAITDLGTPLAALATERRFLRTFIAPADVGGRYSALSPYGLVPAALQGSDLTRLLDAARAMAGACGPGVPAAENPGIQLGVVLAEAALAGRNKATILAPPAIASFGLWAEQLVAESTGKQGQGVIPIADEPRAAPAAYSADRVFISLQFVEDEDASLAEYLTALERAGHPVVRLTLRDRYAVGAEFFRWEFATAIAAAVLRVNAFDQPNVAESKQDTAAVLERRTLSSPPAVSRADLDRFLARIETGHYLALLAYLPPTNDNDRRLATIRARLRDRVGAAVTVGYGPRYLHSTGQLHKGGPASAHFLIVTDPAETDLPVPGKAYTFGMVEAAQAEGDLLALRRHDRPVLWLNGLDLLEEWSATASEA